MNKLMLACLFLVAVTITWLFWDGLGIPSVHWSWSTRECVKVVPAKAGSCDNLPEKYDLIWVK